MWMRETLLLIQFKFVHTNLQKFGVWKKAYSIYFFFIKSSKNCIYVKYYYNLNLTAFNLDMF